MKRFFYTLPFVVLFSFLIGIWWSQSKIEPSQQAKGSLPQIRVATLTSLKPERLAQQVKRHGIAQIYSVTYPTDLALVEAVEDHPHRFDVVLASASVLTYLQGEGYLRNTEALVEEKVSVDFKELLEGFSFPVFLWSVSGWRVPSDTLSEEFDIKEYLLTSDKAKVQVEASSEFLQRLLISLDLFDEHWLTTDKMSRITHALKKIQPSLNFKGSPEAEDAGKIQKWSSGMQTNEGSFVISSRTGHFELVGLAFTSSFNGDHDFIQEFQQNLQQPNLLQALATDTERAIVFDVSTDLPERLKASYLRQLPLRKLNYLATPHAFHPVWRKVLRKTFEIFKKDDSDESGEIK